MKAGDIVVNKRNQKICFYETYSRGWRQRNKTGKFCNILEGESFHGKKIKQSGVMGGKYSGQAKLHWEVVIWGKLEGGKRDHLSGYVEEKNIPGRGNSSMWNSEKAGVRVCSVIIALRPG